MDQVGSEQQTQEELSIESIYFIVSQIPVVGLRTVLPYSEVGPDWPEEVLRCWFQELGSRKCEFIKREMQGGHKAARLNQEGAYLIK